jgi:hypothetical protein
MNRWRSYAGSRRANDRQHAAMRPDSFRDRRPMTALSIDWRNIITTLFTVLICLQFIVNTFHDWLHIPGWTHGRQVRTTIGRRMMLIGTIGNGLFPAIAAGFAIYFWHQPKPPYVLKYWFAYCAIPVIAAIAQWWAPYFFGASEKTKQFYSKLYAGTLQVLPPRGDNPRPNLMHLFFYALFLCTSVLSAILWLQRG